MKKSEILFLYETSYNIPNGDPFTGEQRYDEETKKILVSDVRIKRFIRTYLEDIEDEHIYVSDKTGVGKTDSKGVLTYIAQNEKWNPCQKTDIAEIMKGLIDVRLFGGISTLTNEETKKIKVNKNECTNGHVQFTGPVQFAALNPSLNRVNLKMHQNTSHFTSKGDKAQGAIATTTLVPYSVVQIHGWINPTVAKSTDLKDDDLQKMFKALWYGTGGERSSYSPSKVGQDSLLLLIIDYKENFDKLYGIDRTIKLEPNKGMKDEQIRSMDDYALDFTKLKELAKNDKIEKIRFYTEIDKIKNELNGEKFEEMSL